MNLRPNRAKEKVENGEIAIVVGGMTHADDIDNFGPIAQAHGYDGIWLEGEHGGVDAADLGNLSRACDLWGLTSVARINANHQGLIYRTLDRGAQAIVVPHVNNAEEAQNVVDGGKFPPTGKRGNYTSRQGLGVSDFMQVADDQSLLIILIEDIIAYENLDEILEVDHIGVFFVAPGDFSASMGYSGNPDHPEAKAVMADAYKRIMAAGKVAGATCTSDNVQYYTDLGVQFFLTTTGPWLNEGAGKFMELAKAKSG